jgi:bacteriocin leader peptide (microcyclamide/patellamide family)
MDKKNLMPQQAQPIERITTGQLPDVLAELSEEALWQQRESSGGSIIAGGRETEWAGAHWWICSFDEAE